MSGEIALTLEEKLSKAQGSLNAHALATLLYLKEYGLSVGWVTKMTMMEFIKEEGAFLISIGCALRSLSGDESQAEVVVTSWPPDGDWTAENFLAFFGLSQEDADAIWHMYGPIASHLGLTMDGDEVTLTFTRQP